MDKVLIESDTGCGIHEVVSAFNHAGMPLSLKLTEMLNEHFIHQSERRGCGYTQATRVLAEYINQPRCDHRFDDFRLFEDSTMKPLRDVMTQANAYGLVLSCWRNLDVNPVVQDFLQRHDPRVDAFARLLSEQMVWQYRLRHIHKQVKREESLLIVSIIQDIILPPSAIVSRLVHLPVLGEKPKVGSCPMAEKFFLEIAFRKIPRRGLVNVFVDGNNQPLLMEKVNMGDDHSCVSLEPVILNGVRLPIGSSFAVAYDEEKISKQSSNFLAGHIVNVSDIQGFWFLRLTTLAVSPENRERAFSTHFRQQIENDLFSPDVATLSQLKEVAEQQVASISQIFGATGVKQIV